MKNTRIILALLFISTITMGGLIWHISQLQRDLIHSTALKTAELYSVALTQFRNIYTSEVVAKTQSMGIDIAHDYASRKDAIPLPSALTMRMAEEISKNASGSKAQLFSPYPFSLGGKGNKTPYSNFENKAWDFLVKNPDQVYSRFDEAGTGTILQYATSDIMQEQCVACHNSHPDSPKNNWKTGDVGGVLIINLPLDDIIIETEKNLKSISIIYFSIGIGLVLIIGIVIVRLRQQSQKTQHDRDFSQGLLNTAPVIVLLLDTHGCIQYVNPYFEKLCGYKLDEIKGKEWVSTFLPEHDQDRIRQLLRSAERGDQVDGNINPIVCRNGKEHQIEWYARTMRDDAGKVTGVLSIGQDVTIHRQKEEALIVSEQRLIESQKIAHLGHWIWNIVDGTLEWSDEHYRIFGVEPGEITPSYEAFLDTVHPDDREKCAHALTEAMTNNNYNMSHRLLLPDGVLRYVHGQGRVYYDKAGEPVRMMGTIQDITEQTLAEREIEKSRSRFEAIFESIPDAIVYVDPDRKIQMVNSATIQIFGYEEAELTGNQTKMLYASPEVFMDQGKERFNPKSEAKNIPYEVMYRRKDGQEFTGETLGIPVKSLNGEILGYLGIIRDVTERKRIDTELLKYREHLEELVQKRTALMQFARDESVKANKAKSEFLTRMSHELRTPMNAILGFGQILELDAEGFTETQQGNVKEILDASRHLMDLINEVLDLAKIESGKLEITMENVSVDDVLQQSIALIQPLAASRYIELTDHVYGNGYVIKADITRLKQVLVNLLSNAIKYNRENGSVTLDSEHIDKQRLRIRVMDTGKGLTEKEIAKLFKPFVRLDKVNNVEGTGIGLVITKHLVELMGGTIGVECTPGEGCTFWVEFELIKDA